MIKVVSGMSMTDTFVATNLEEPDKSIVGC